MPQLTRTGARLLRKVDNKRHATDNDHEERSGRPKKSPKLHDDQDLDRDPLSSSDNDESHKDDIAPSVFSSSHTKTASTATSIDLDNHVSLTKPQRKASGRGASLNGHDQRRMPVASKSISLTSDGANGSDDEPMFGMGSMRQKAGATFSRRPATSSTNFHIHHKAPKAAKKPTVNGFNQPKGIKHAASSPKTESAFKTPPKVPGAELKQLKGPSFKMPGDPSQSTRRSSRIASQDGDAKDIQISGFKSVRGLSGLDLSHLNETAKQFDVPQMDSPDDHDPVVHSSQLDPEHVDIDDDVGLEDTQFLSGDEEEDAINCPYCHNIISDPDLIDIVKTHGKVMNMSRQAAFCRQHRKAEAQKQWDERGYPVIDWEALALRVEGLHNHVSQIIHNSQPSIFRAKIEDKLASGGGRSMLQTLTNDATSLDTLTPGYYGGRGAKLISSQLMADFSDEIRKRAGLDKVIGATGAGGFVQAVLVPEVVVRLIMQDLDVEEQRALEVLQESAEIGDLLCEEDEDSGCKG